MYTSHSMSRKFNTKKFIKDVLNDKYALVIGNENILDKKIEPTGDVHQFFLRKVNDVSQIHYKDYYEIALDKGEKINPIRQLIEEEEIDAIISSSWPITCHTIAKDLNEKYNLPWIADLRDLWNLNPYVSQIQIFHLPKNNQDFY